MKTSLILTALFCAIALPHSHAAGPGVSSGVAVADNIAHETPRARLMNLSEDVGEHDGRLSIAGAESSSDDTQYFRLVHSTRTWIARPAAADATQGPPEPGNTRHWAPH